MTQITKATKGRAAPFTTEGGLIRAQTLTRGLLKLLDAGIPNATARHAISSIEGAELLFPTGHDNDYALGRKGSLNNAAAAIVHRGFTAWVETGKKRNRKLAIIDRVEAQRFADHGDRPKLVKVRIPRIRKTPKPGDVIPLTPEVRARWAAEMNGQNDPRSLLRLASFDEFKKTNELLAGIQLTLSAVVRELVSLNAAWQATPPTT